MPKYILSHMHGDVRLYHEFSTIVDAPVTPAMTFEEFRGYYREEYGRDSMDRLQERLNRAALRGSSRAIGRASFEEEICCNRAGAKESRLSMPEYIAMIESMRAESGLDPL